MHRLSLQYHPEPRRRWHHIIFATLAVAFAGVLVWRAMPGAVQRAQLWRAQRACASYVFPADAEPPYIPPSCWTGLARMTDTWYPQSGCTVSSRGTSFDSYVAFLHERSRPAGDRRLVAVQTYAPPGCSLDEADPRWDVQNPKYQCVIEFAYEVRPRVPLAGGGDVPNILRRGLLSSDAAIGSTLQIFCGQPDRDNPSRFSFRYILDGEPGTIDADLLDDDTVTFSVRDGPLRGTAIRPWS